jgi:hypothetical protein
MKAKLIAKNPNKEYRCSGCGVVGTWKSWESWSSRKHRCDACWMDGLETAKLIPIDSDPGMKLRTRKGA